MRSRRRGVLRRGVHFFSEFLYPDIWIRTSVKAGSLCPFVTGSHLFRPEKPRLRVQAIDAPALIQRNRHRTRFLAVKIDRPRVADDAIDIAQILKPLETGPEQRRPNALPR